MRDADLQIDPNPDMRCRDLHERSREPRDEADLQSAHHAIDTSKRAKPHHGGGGDVAQRRGIEDRHRFIARARPPRLGVDLIAVVKQHPHEEPVGERCERAGDEDRSNDDPGHANSPFRPNVN